MRLFLTVNLLGVLAVLVLIYGPLYLFAQHIAPVGVL